jgi:hypothetical protein
MSKYDDAFAPPSPEELSASQARSAVSSLQTSLYQRLRGRYMGRSGSVGWTLIRASQATHPDREAARAALARLPASELAELLLVARRARDAARNDAWRKAAAAVVAVLTELHTAAAS